MNPQQDPQNPYTPQDPLQPINPAEDIRQEPVPAQPQFQPQPVAQPVFQQQGQAVVENENSKIWHPKYWLTVIGFIALYFGLQALDKLVGIAIFSLIGRLIGLAGLIGVIVHVVKLREAGVDALSKSAKFRAVVFMAIDPLVSQAVYYFGLKRKLPEDSKKLNAMGWKVLLVQILIGLTLFGLLVLVVAAGGIEEKAWYSKNNDTFANSSKKLAGELVDMGTAARSTDAAMMLDNCRKISSDVAEIKAIPPYPKKNLAQPVTAALDKLTQGATDCETGVNNRDVATYANAANELAGGITDLGTAYKAIQDAQQESKK